ncbi:PilW family protein [Peribacillus saganii]|nr:type II secretion system protein [Peribacillus saganii]
MRRTFKDQKALTLIELLAALTILSFMILLVSGVFINGISYSNKAKSTVMLHEEANYIVTFLTKKHETQKSYTIELDNNPNASMITITDDSGSSQVISSSDYRYSLYENSGGTDTLMDQRVDISSTSAQSLSFKLVIQDAKNPKNQFELKTIISRL